MDGLDQAREALRHLEQNYERRISQLEDKLQQREREIDGLGDEVRRAVQSHRDAMRSMAELKREVDNARQVGSRPDQTLERLNARILEFEERVRMGGSSSDPDAARRYEDVKDTAKILKAELEKRDATITQLRAEINEAKAKYEEAKQSLDANETVTANLKQKVLTFELSEKDADSRFRVAEASLQSQIIALREEVKEGKQREANIVKKSAEDKRQAEVLERRCAMHKDQVEDLRKAVAVAQEYEMEYRRKEEALRSQADSAKQNAAKAQSGADEAKQALDAVTAERDALSSKLVKLREDLRAQHLNEIKEWKERMASATERLELSLAEVEGNLAEACETRDKAIRDSEMYKRAVERISKEGADGSLLSLQHKVTQLQRELKEESALREEIQMAKESAEMQLRRSRAEDEQLRIDVQQRLASTQRERTVLSQSNAQRSEEIESLKAELDKSHRQQRDLEREKELFIMRLRSEHDVEKNKWATERDDLDQSVREASLRIAGLEELVSEKENAGQSMAQEWRDKTLRLRSEGIKEIEALRSQNGMLSSRCDELNTTVTKLRSELEAASANYTHVARLRQLLQTAERRLAESQKHARAASS